jgi:catechol 2,3-dioxygenase-like lactoylglutathione lyase family enzyme
MEIRQFRVVLRARDFERTSRFYGEVLALPRVQSWDREDGRGALYQAGAGVIEILGRHRGGEHARDEAFDYEGPQHKLAIQLIVPSAEAAYEELRFREPNVSGGLHLDTDGNLVFETSDPDGVKVIFRQAD